jgi:hypothetical protein
MMLLSYRLLASTASRAAKMACTGMRPLATSCPPERRRAAATGAAQRFSHTSTAAEVPGSSAAAASWEVLVAQRARGRPLEVGEGRGHLLEITNINCRHRPVLTLGHERDVQDPDNAAIHEIQQQRLHLPGGRQLPRPLQDHIIDRGPSPLIPRHDQATCMIGAAG